MIKIDNIEKIKKLLVFKNSDTFYHLQLIRRKKENPDMNVHQMNILETTITSLSEFDDKIEVYKRIANETNSRVYINLNAKSFERVAKMSRIKLNDLVADGSYRSVKDVFTSMSSKSSTAKSYQKYWVIDCDDFNMLKCYEVVEHLNSFSDNTFVLLNETINGFHLITKPFNLSKFNFDGLSIEDIKRNDLTLIYYTN